MLKGIPGLNFSIENSRIYPSFRQASHVLGAVNWDNTSFTGIESHIDETHDMDALHASGLGRGAKMPCVPLSIDMRIQHVLHRELEDALSRHQAIAASFSIIDVSTGELVSLVSLPDEPASIFKPIKVAGALNASVVSGPS